MKKQPPSLDLERPERCPVCGSPKLITEPKP